MYVAMQVPYMVQNFDGESVDSFDKILAIYPIKFSQWLFTCKVALIGTIRQNFTCQIFLTLNLSNFCIIKILCHIVYFITIKVIINIFSKYNS